MASHIKIGDVSVCQYPFTPEDWDMLFDAGVIPVCAPGDKDVEWHATQLREFGFDARVVHTLCDQQDSNYYEED